MIAPPRNQPIPPNGDANVVARDIALNLLAYCRRHDWAGDDPYDALNSRIFRAAPFLHHRWPRLVLTQLNKRSPINLRRLLMVPTTHNPKGLALFLASLVKLSRAGVIDVLDSLDPMATRLLALRSEATPYVCWGYNFDWQTRFELVPRGLPNIICTSFAANALLDVYESVPAPRYLEAAVSAARFILDVLHWNPTESESCFSYTPLWRARVHNANLLGAALLCRVAAVSGERSFREVALAAARYSAKKQYDDGSWDYGESDQPSQRWKDNFHTGYNLCALRSIGRHAATSEFEPHVRSGFAFYRGHFFREDGAPRYYHDATYPIDIHSAAQSIITLIALRDLGTHNVDMAHAVLNWTIENMHDTHTGSFYYQKHRRYTVRISYMRWAQAWMLHALATLLDSAPQPVLLAEESECQRLRPAP